MSLQTLTLDLAKITAYTPQTPTIRQNDAGESLPIILGRGGESIDLTKSVVTLYLEKSSGKIIQVSSDTAPDAWTINDDGTMSVVLPPETYQAHGDIKVGYLRIKTGDLVESTSSFSIRVLPAKGSPEADDSYISDAAKIVGDIKSKDAAAQVVLEQTRAKYTELDTAMATATKAATDATNATTAATTATDAAKTATANANDAAKSANDAAGKAIDATADTIEIKKSTEDLLATIPTDPNYKGPKGDTGSGLDLKGTTPPEAGEKDGDTYLVDGRLVVWQDGKWADGGQVQGPKGDNGDKGDTGDQGISAYQVAVNAGFSGSVGQWLASLIGAKGDTGDKGDDAVINIISQADYDALADKSGVYFIEG